MDRPSQIAPARPGSGIPRRKWLASLVIGGTFAALGGVVALVRTGGYKGGAATELRVLVLWQYAVVRAVARRILAADRAEGVPSPDEVGVAEFVDGYLVEMRPALRRDLLRMLRYVEQLAPIGAGFAGRFTDLAPSEQDEVLLGLESSRFDQLRAGFQAVKSIVMLGYYRDPRTFSILGYAGPFIVEPAELLP
jgi:gluconate 2-dehydrogenase subunit 3-like protein